MQTKATSSGTELQAGLLTAPYNKLFIILQCGGGGVQCIFCSISSNNNNQNNSSDIIIFFKQLNFEVC